MLSIDTLSPARLARIGPALLVALIEKVWLLGRGWMDADLAVTATDCGLVLTITVGDRPVAGDFLPFDIAPCPPPEAV